MTKKELEYLKSKKILSVDDIPEVKKSMNRGWKKKLGRLLDSRKRKVIAAVLLCLVVIGLLFGIPATRFTILGTFIKKDVSILITDASTSKPVSQATVRLNGDTATTASDGTAKFKTVPVGNYVIMVNKRYYKDAQSSYVVPIVGESQRVQVAFTATGRQVNVSVVNKITKQPLVKALLKIGDTSTETDNKGDATVVLPADKKSLPGIITAKGYNDASISAMIVENSTANTFSLAPSGKIYFLSKRTGKINVMESDLDGAKSNVVIEGTGSEQDSSTSLLAARDWRYLALQSHREESRKGQLYLIDTKTRTLKTIDEGDVDITLVGWSGHQFIYIVHRSYSYYTDKNDALKSYNADTGKLSILEETHLVSGLSENINNLYIVKDKIIYTKSWWDNKGTQGSINVINPDGTGRRDLKDINLGVGSQGYLYLQSKFYEPGGVYYNINDKIFEYEDGSVKQTNILPDDINSDYYPTYLLSPSDKKTFWYEPRDGKNTVFVGDQDAKNPKSLANLTDFTTYGWYGEDYVLLSKNGSELYIASASDSFDKVSPIKITDYHIASQTYPGYGSGYGGL